MSPISQCYNEMDGIDGIDGWMAEIDTGYRVATVQGCFDSVPA